MRAVLAAMPASAQEPRRRGDVLRTLPTGWEPAELKVGDDDRPTTVPRPEDWLDLDTHVEIDRPRGEPFGGTRAVLGAWGDRHLARRMELKEDERYEPLAWNDVGWLGAARLRIGGGLVRGRVGATRAATGTRREPHRGAGRGRPAGAGDCPAPNDPALTGAPNPLAQ